MCQKQVKTSEVEATPVLVSQCWLSPRVHVPGEIDRVGVLLEQLLTLPLYAHPQIISRSVLLVTPLGREIVMLLSVPLLPEKEPLTYWMPVAAAGCRATVMPTSGILVVPTLLPPVQLKVWEPLAPAEPC